MQKIENGLVVLLDALGVSRFSIDECADFVRKRDEIRTAILSSYLLDIKREWFNVSLEPTISTQFGDTLLFAWSFDGKSDAAKSVLFDALMRWLADLLWQGIEQQVLYRGAVSIGPILIADPNTVIGPAVADASAWYEQADWFGVCATPSCGITIDYFKLLRQEISGDDYGLALREICGDTLGISAAAETWSKALIRYEVPLHAGGQEMWVVSWPYASLQDKNTDGSVRKELFAALMLGVLPKPIPKVIERKYENSIKFFDHCIKT